MNRFYYVFSKSKKIIVYVAVAVLLGFLVCYYVRNDFSIEEFIITLWEEYVEDFGYVILFFWGILEGELGLIFAGLAAHDQKMNLFLAIFVAGFGGFVGDQIYFYIGRFNRNTIQQTFKSQRRQFALASLLLKKYGWIIIFLQRYMYGMRTILPISIGTTRYSALKFGIINFFSAQIWASITIVITYLFGSIIFTALDWLKDYIYLFILLAILCIIASVLYLRTQSRHMDKKIKKLKKEIKK